MGEPPFVDRLDGTWQPFLVAIAIMALISFAVVGVSPGTLGAQHSTRVALAAAPLTLWLRRVLGPFSRLLIALTNAVTPGKGFRDGPFASEAELRELVDLAEENQLIEDRERAMIHSVFELGDTIVREVMVPRTDVVFIERHKTLRQFMSLALRSGFSRIPVVGEDVDDVLGIVYLKDVVRRTYEHRDAETTERVEQLMRPAVFVPDSKPVDELLRDLQAQRIHLAVVVDEYGGTAGIVTIEDVLEALIPGIEESLRARAAAGEVPADLHPGVAAQAIAAMTSRALAWWVEDPTRATREQLIETLCRMHPVHR